MTDRHSVLVVEDDIETQRHIASAVSTCTRLALLAAVGTYAEAVRTLQRGPPDVLLTDLQLPDGHGVDLIRLARQLSPHTQILVISVFGDERTVIASVHAGASGYLLKDGNAAEISASVLQLLDGGSPLSASVARHVLRLVQSRSSSLPASHSGNGAMTAGRNDAPLPRLTNREVEVLELLAKGFSCQEIGHLLSISHHTVVTHTRNIHRKLEVNSRSAAVFEAISLGLIRP